MPRTHIEIDDLYRLGWAEHPAVSPDGRWVAYVRVTIDRAGNRYRRAIWLVASDGSQQRKLTAGSKSDTSPCWSPDGSQLAFVSNRDELPQIYLIDMAGGEARCLTAHPQGASDPAWSPNGRQIAFLARTTTAERASEDAEPQPAPADELERRHRRERLAKAEELRADPRVIERMPFRTGTTYDDLRRAHIYLIDVPADHASEPGAARRITDGELGYGTPAWAVDGSALISTCGRDIDADTLFGFDDVVRVPVLAQGRANPARLTQGGDSYMSPQPSPDGRWIAALRRDAQRPLARATALVLIPAAGGEPLDLTGHADLDIEGYRWAASSDAIYCLAPSWGDQPIYRVAAPPAAASITPLAGVPQRYITELSLGSDGQIAFIAGMPSNPCELYLSQADGSEQQLTQLGGWLADEKIIAPFEELRYTASDGSIVQGWVLYPPDFSPAQPAPLVAHIHGGPHLMWSPGYRGMWHEFQATAARGYITFFCNPRGSEGYGEAWRDGVHGDWGCAGADILAGIDLLVARGHVDTARIAVTGGSYGGYMTAWLLAHDQRFACGVAARGVFDLTSFYGTSDAHELIEFEFDGPPWERHALLWEQSPLAHAHRITAPLLILHAELDWRVPIAQAEQLFGQLRRRKVPVELVRYPREGHELTRAGEPDHRADHMRRTIAWIDRYCGAVQIG